jgi:signal transduction histidine kinase/ActR/RegA family two-component response regulator
VELLTSPPNGLRHEVRADTRVYEVIARPIPSGPEPEQWILLIDDVTQSRQLQTQMQLQERLATVGQMAAGIAHDFNNIMAVILLYAEMAARTTTLPERDRERLLTIKQQAYRATDLIRQILDFSRQSMLERQLIDLLPLVKEQVKLLERTLPESITTRLDLDQESYVVHADPTRMQQLVMNLAINARDAMPDGGELSIGLARMRVESELGGEHADRPAREWVQLTVADTGEGIPTEVLPRIFDPFFTTKAHGKGTGLGLAQVHGIVAQHDGTIEVTTEPAQGTTFTVYLPARATDSTVVPITFGAETALGHGELVLVVEDNFALRMAMTEMVEAMHYQVVVAADGQAALHLLQTRGHEVAVVLSDVVMPNLGGVALLHAMREQGWTMPVIFMTGHSLETDMAALEGDEVFAWLPKPVSPLQLAGALADAVAQA